MNSGIHPAPVEFDADQLSVDPILQFFHYAHLPLQLQGASAPFCRLALTIIETLPRNAERSTALRKLLEAKDAAVRANVPAPQSKKPYTPEAMIYPDRAGEYLGERVTIHQPEFDRDQEFRWDRSVRPGDANLWVPVLRGKIEDMEREAIEEGGQSQVREMRADPDEALPFNDGEIDPAVARRNKRG